MGTVTYTKTERVKIELDEDDVENAVRRYLANRVTIPDTAKFWWATGQEVFSGVSIQWDEAPEPVVEATE